MKRLNVMTQRRKGAKIGGIIVALLWATFILFGVVKRADTQSRCQQLVFVMASDGNSEVYWMDVDTREKRKLTQNEVRDTAPVWSPDGQRIAYLEFPLNEVYPSIMIMDANGENRRELLKQAATRELFWSPNGQNIAFASFENDWGIYILDVEKGIIHKTVNNADFVSWSPDSQKFGFITQQNGLTGIYQVNNDGREITKLAETSSTIRPIAWSPDWTEIAFGIDHDTITYNQDLYVMNADGTHVQQLFAADNMDLGLTWVPGLRKLAFSNYWKDPNEFYSSTVGLYTLDLKTGVVKEFGHIKDRMMFYPAWSPDGTLVAFLVFDNPSQTAEIYLSNADGKNPHFLTDTSSNSGQTFKWRTRCP